MTRTGLASKLLAHYDSPFVQLNPQCCRELAVTDGDLLEVRSTQGKLLLPVIANLGISPGHAFLPMHWNGQFAGNAGVGKIIAARVDPISGQPETKLEAVALHPVRIKAWMSLVSICEIDVDQFDYWHKVPVEKGYRYLLGLKHEEPGNFDPKAWITEKFPMADLIEFSDAGYGDNRIACFEDEKLTAIVFCVPSHGSLPGSNWLGKILGAEQHSMSWQLLAGKELHREDIGKLICSCHEVGENQIRKAIIAGCSDHDELGDKLRCGTNCGSCIPELKQLVTLHKNSLADPLNEACQ